MTTAADILLRLNEKLNDLDATRWPDVEHFRAISDAQQAILEARPDLFEKYANVLTVEGSAQAVPADCYRLFDVVSNLDATNVRVSGITKVDRATLDRHVRNWMVMDASDEADHWMQDAREYDRFYLVPPQPSSGRGKLELRYSATPDPITASGDTIASPDEAINALYNFCMHRALEKDEKFAGSQTAASYMDKFGTFIGSKGVADEQFANTRDLNEKS